jgi:regulator of sirC expression with transglutaminase-like and TPR domain
MRTPHPAGVRDTMSGMPEQPTFAELAASPTPALDMLALALAAEFRDVDAGRALARLDLLGKELAEAVERTEGDPEAQAREAAVLLGGVYRFSGDREDYDHPDNSMLDVVLVRRRGLPIVLSVVYAEVARRAEIPLAGVGLPGHFVVGHFGMEPPLLLDPFAGGGPFAGNAPSVYLQPWTPTEIAMRMLNNLVATYRRRGDLTSAIHAAGMRLALPAEEDQHDALREELRMLRSELS